MGYTTKFSGQLLFANEPTAKELAKLKTFFGEDCRDHKEWDAEGSYIDLVFNDDFTGIIWDEETEKNNGMVSHVNLIIREMKKEFPEFELKGQLVAQGEIFSDRWILKIENGIAIEKKIEIKGEKVTCPNCDHEFILESE